MNIPKTIVQVWINKDPLNKQMQEAVNTWKDKNPEYEHILMNEEDCKLFLKENFASDVQLAFDTINPIAGKVDLFRYCYLTAKGGVYVDIDNICIKPLDEWLTDKDKFVGVLDLPCLVGGSFYNRHLAIQNSLIICQQGHPFVWHAHKLATYNILNRVHPNPIGIPQGFSSLIKITGPKLLADAIKMSLNNPWDKAFSLLEECTPCGYRFPAKLVVDRNEKYHDRFNKCNIVDAKNNILVQMKYEGYNPENYWTTQQLYNHNINPFKNERIKPKTSYSSNETKD